jgi:hypothetical protein
MDKDDAIERRLVASDDHLASSEEMARLAVNPDWSCNIHDPRNARYLRPLSIAADEQCAYEMATASYRGEVDCRNDMEFEQSLVDARRMMRDREYWGLFAPEGDFAPLLQRTRARVGWGFMPVRGTQRVLAQIWPVFPRLPLSLVAAGKRLGRLGAPGRLSRQNAVWPSERVSTGRGALGRRNEDNSERYLPQADIY